MVLNPLLVVIAVASGEGTAEGVRAATGSRGRVEKPGPMARHERKKVREDARAARRIKADIAWRWRCQARGRAGG